MTAKTIAMLQIILVHLVATQHFLTAGTRVPARLDVQMDVTAVQTQSVRLKNIS